MPEDYPTSSNNNRIKTTTPIFMVDRISRQVPSGSQKRVALDFLAQNKLGGQKLLYIKPVTIDGLSGYEAVAQGIVDNPDAVLNINQTLLFSKGEIFILIADIDAKFGAKLTPAVEKRVKSFKQVSNVSP